MDLRVPLALLTFALALGAWVLVARVVRADGWDSLDDDVREAERRRRAAREKGSDPFSAPRSGAKEKGSDPFSQPPTSQP